MTTEASTTTAADATGTTTATTGETIATTTADSSTQGQGTGETTGTAPTAEQIAADAAASAAAAKPAGAPEQYADFTPPEGTTFDPTIMGKFAETAKALNLPQEAAQQLVDQMAPVMAAQHTQQIESLKAEWLATTTADPEIGGAKLTESVAMAAKARDAFATPALKEIFNGTGFGNHPEMVRFMAKVGRAISDDKVVIGGQTAPAGIRSHADRLYPASSKP